MKKLMVLAAVAAMALGAKAEMMAWNIALFIHANGDSQQDEDALGNYYRAYLIYNSGDLAAVVDYLKGADISAVKQAAVRIFDTTKGIKVDMSGSGQYGFVLDSEALGTTWIEGDLTHTYFVAYYGEKVDSSPTEYLVMGNPSESGKGMLWFNELEGTTSSGWQSVPEPTSGLLLLLGMAGLALKRKLNG